VGRSPLAQMWTHIRLLDLKSSQPIHHHKSQTCQLASARCTNGWSSKLSSPFHPKVKDKRTRAPPSCPCHGFRSSKYSAASPAPSTPRPQPQLLVPSPNPQNGLRIAVPRPRRRWSRGRRRETAVGGRATLIHSVPKHNLNRNIPLNLSPNIRG